MLIEKSPSLAQPAHMGSIDCFSIIERVAGIPALN